MVLALGPSESPAAGCSLEEDAVCAPTRFPLPSTAASSALPSPASLDEKLWLTPAVHAANAPPAAAAEPDPNGASLAVPHSPLRSSGSLALEPSTDAFAAADEVPSL